MSWVAVHDGARGSKLIELSHVAGCSGAEALGILVNIWLEGARENRISSDGKMVNFRRKDILKVFNNEVSEGLDADRILDALIQTGWIDEIDGQFFVHDWEDAQEPLVKYQRERENAARRKREQRQREKERSATGTAPHYESPPAREEAPDAEPTPPATPPSAPTQESKYGSSFETLWNAYPRKDEKSAAYRCYQARLKDGYSEEEMLKATQAYAEQLRKDKTEKKYIKQAKTFLGPNTPFTDYIRKEPVQNREEQMPDYRNPFAEYGED